MTVGLVHLDSCPRHPLLSVWLLVQVLYCVLYHDVLHCTVLQGLVTSLASLCLLSLPACRLSNTSLDPGNGTSVSRCNTV